MNPLGYLNYSGLKKNSEYLLSKIKTNCYLNNRNAIAFRA